MSQRTVKFQEVLYDVAFLLGLRPGENLLVAQVEAIGRHIARAVRWAWDEYPWNEIEVTESLALDSDFEANYPAAAVEITGAWDRDPRAEPNEALPVQFVTEGRRLYFGEDSASSPVYVRYTTAAPSLTGVEYSATEAVPEGAVRYYPTDGHCYLCIDATTGNIDDTDFWTVQDSILAVFREPVVEKAYALALIEDGAHDQGRLRERMASDALGHAIERDCRRQKQGTFYQRKPQPRG